MIMSILRRYDGERNRKTIVAGKAPLAGSTGKRSGEGTQGPETAADQGECNFRESITTNNLNDIGTVGEFLWEVFKVVR